MRNKITVDCHNLEADYHLEVSLGDGLTTDDMGEVFKVILLLMGYHPQNVKELFGDYEDDVSEADKVFDDTIRGHDEKA